MRCDATVTHDQCLAEFQGTIDCSRAVGVALTQEECFDAVEVASCDAPALPKPCSGMIQVSQ